MLLPAPLPSSDENPNRPEGSLIVPKATLSWKPRSLGIITSVHRIDEADNPQVHPKSTDVEFTHGPTEGGRSISRADDVAIQKQGTWIGRACWNRWLIQCAPFGPTSHPSERSDLWDLDLRLDLCDRLSSYLSWKTDFHHLHPRWSIMVPSEVLHLHVALGH